MSLGSLKDILLDRRHGLRVLLLGMALLFVAKHVLVPLHYPAAGLRDLDYGYGPRAAMLAETGEFASCRETCARATRMPGPILALAGLRLALGDDVRLIALAKGVILEGVLLAVLVVTFRRGLSLAGALALLSCMAGPQFLMHSHAIRYEEGFAIPMMAATMALLLSLLDARPAPLGRASLAAALIGMMMVIKSALAPVALGGLGALLPILWRAAPGRAFAPRALLVVLLALGPVTAWGLYNVQTGGAFRVGSSADGANLWRGLNDGAVALYPPMDLDYLLRPPRAVTNAWTGEVVEIRPPEPGPRGLGEWARNDWFVARALDWVRANPLPALEMTARKAVVFFLEVRNTPVEPGEAPVKGVIGWLGIAWMAWMRLLTGAAVVLLAAVLVRRRRAPDATVAAAALGLGFLALYAAPYVLAFGYERHAVAGFAPFLIAAVFVAGRTWEAEASAVRPGWRREGEGAR